MAVKSFRQAIGAEQEDVALAAGHRAGTWDFGDLPKRFEPEWNGYRLRGYPALVDDGDAVRVQVFFDEASQRAAMAAGTRRLVLLNLPARGPLETELGWKDT